MTTNAGQDLREAVLAWWKDHEYDAYPDGDGDERNAYDEPPEFVRIALTAAQGDGAPVAWIRQYMMGGAMHTELEWNDSEEGDRPGEWTPLYTHPAQPAPVTTGETSMTVTDETLARVWNALPATCEGSMTREDLRHALSLAQPAPVTERIEADGLNNRAGCMCAMNVGELLCAACSQALQQPAPVTDAQIGKCSEGQCDVCRPAAALSPAAQRVDGIAPRDRLWDSQWVNIVNHANCYRDMDKDEAVACAVKLTEQAMAANLSPAAQATPHADMVPDWAIAQAVREAAVRGWQGNSYTEAMQGEHFLKAAAMIAAAEGSL